MNVLGEPREAIGKQCIEIEAEGVSAEVGDRTLIQGDCMLTKVFVEA
jgi:hypothetical protein